MAHADSTKTNRRQYSFSVGDECEAEEKKEDCRRFYWSELSATAQDADYQHRSITLNLQRKNSGFKTWTIVRKTRHNNEQGFASGQCQYCIRQQPPPVALQFLLPAKRREERQTDFISAISTKGGAKREYVHDTINIIDTRKGRSLLRSQAKRLVDRHKQEGSCQQSHRLPTNYEPSKRKG